MPQELPGLIAILSRRIVGEEDAGALAREVMDFVTRHLGRDYPWPGNVRELEQCVRNVMIRGEYHPAHMTRAGRSSPDDDLVGLIRGGSLSAEELLSRYCTHVYAQLGSYEAAARRLGLDRRTVKAKLDPELLQRLRDARE